MRTLIRRVSISSVYHLWEAVNPWLESSEVVLKWGSFYFIQPVGFQ
jgi:hypothetical protein